MAGNIIPEPDSLGLDYKVKLEQAKQESIAKATQHARFRRKQAMPAVDTKNTPKRPVLSSNPPRENKMIHTLVERKSMKEESPETLFLPEVPYENVVDRLAAGESASTAIGGDFSRNVSAKKRKRVISESEPSTGRFENIDRIPPSKYTTNRSGAQKRPYAPAKKASKSKTVRAEYDIIEAIDTRTTQHSSEWYHNIDLKQRFSRGDLENLKYLSTLIRMCISQSQSGEDTTGAVAKLRQRIHQAEFYDFLSGVLIKKCKLLEDGGLSLIFDNNDGIFPWDVRSDSLHLHQKWLAGKIDPHLLVGVESKNKKSGSGKDVKTRNLEHNYAGRVSCNYVGQGNLQNGQWWPLQICAMRDGAHGEIEAGISGQSGKGAFSIVLSSGGYADVDEGEKLKYCGTSGIDGKPSAGTQKMLESFKLRSPIRVLRSAALAVKNLYRPAKGLRYDGLYRITDFTVLDEDTAMHQFTLAREAGQHPIRYTGVEQRPTNEELAEYTKIRKLLGLGA